MISRILMIAAVSLTLSTGRRRREQGTQRGHRGEGGGSSDRVRVQRPRDRLLHRRSRRQAFADQRVDGEGGRAGGRKDQDDRLVASGTEPLRRTARGAPGFQGTRRVLDADPRAPAPGAVCDARIARFRVRDRSLADPRRADRRHHRWTLAGSRQRLARHF
jgi:hypothetical protein